MNPEAFLWGSLFLKRSESGLCSHREGIWILEFGIWNLNHSLALPIAMFFIL